MSLEELNALPPDQAEARFRDCCAAEPWVQGMVDNRPYTSREAMLAQSQRLWPTLTERDWLQAFEAHPRIGDVDSLRKKYASSKALASGEQAGARSADEDVLRRLKQGNDTYLEKFGFIFIVCATGKSAKEMLHLLEARLPNGREMELKNAAREQARITEIRLEKLA
ncbi:2-oxo-4-hydroxy-4-carboxy-5-ureidoimidazoline decarboxylase [Marinobacter sp.]|uniref:2-oxo-4-hydroxy-4-carboxy-5-ureidoimidazoline decarboxylase n=1 Tax=Marinobacter sp. TaxID=50741 RepID=UPI00356898CB